MTQVKSKELMDSFQKLSRVIKRRSAIMDPDSYGRTQCKVLRIIAAHDGINARDLAAVLDIKPPSLTVKLNKLEADGCIVRHRDENDGRFIYIHITPKGYETLSKSDEKKKYSKRDFCDCLSDEEKASFIEMCNRLSINLTDIIEDELAQSKKARLAKANRVPLTDEDEF